jgi:hypothetical protein
MRVFNVPNIIPAGTVMNATINSSSIPLYQMYGYSIQVVFTGTPTGSFKLQGSDDPVPQAGSPSITAAPVPTNWSDIANSSQSVSAAGNFMWNVYDVIYNYARLVYTDSSGGTSTAIITVSTFNGKGV